MHHHLGFEPPERSGFDGLWSALAAPVENGRAPHRAEGADERHHVARSHGSSSPAVTSAVAALLRARPVLDAAA